MKEPQAIFSLVSQPLFTNGRDKKKKWQRLVHEFVYSVSLLDLKFKLECESFSSDGSVVQREQ